MEQQPRLPLWFLFANWAMILVALGVGWFLGKGRRPDLPEPQATALALVHKQILESHVDPQDASVLLDRAIAGMVGKDLDPYSHYVSPRELAAYNEANTGHYEGIGVLMVQHGEDLVVYYPFPGGPAERAGLRPGDRIVAVDGHDLRSTPIETRNTVAAEFVRGHAGTEVSLRIARDTGETGITLQRSGVQQKSVKWAHFADAEQGLGYVLISDFHVGVANELHAAIAALREQRPLRGLIVDLRFNGGGSLDECVAIGNAFLSTGTIVSHRRRSSEIVERFDAKPELCRYPELPLVVLQNASSASASEVLAGALQDHGRAAIVGVRSFGKGFVNTVYSWQDLPFKLKLTTAHFYTPSGRNIERHHLARADAANTTSAERAAADAGGITPDVVVPVTDAETKAIRTVLDSHEPPATYLAAFTAVAAKYGARVPAPPAAASDKQLLQALGTLRERAAAGGGPQAPQVAPKDR